MGRKAKAKKFLKSVQKHYRHNVPKDKFKRIKRLTNKCLKLIYHQTCPASRPSDHELEQYTQLLQEVGLRFKNVRQLSVEHEAHLGNGWRYHQVNLLLHALEQGHGQLQSELKIPGCKRRLRRRLSDASLPEHLKSYSGALYLLLQSFPSQLMSASAHKRRAMERARQLEQLLPLLVRWPILGFRKDDGYTLCILVR